MRFFNRILRLGSIYQFDGGQSYVDEVELSRPVTLVHNVAREAEVATGVGIGEGWGIGVGAVVHAGVGSLDTTLNLLTAIAAAFPGIDIGQCDVWLFDCWPRTTVAGQFTSAWMMGPSGGGSVTGRLFRRWTGELATAGASGFNLGIPTYENLRPIKLNFAMPGNVTMDVASTVIGAVTITFQFLFWAGAKGALPPLVA